MKKIILGLVVLLAACGQQETKTKKIVIGFGVPDGHFEQEALVKFKEYVEDKSKGSLEVELHSGNSIGVDQEVLEQMKIGVAQMNLPAPSVLANFVPAMSLLEFPFLFEDQQMALEIVNGPWGERLNAGLEKSGYVSLGIAPFGVVNMSTTEKMIQSMADLKGLKVRTVQNNMRLAFYRAWGANPTPMPFSELFSALQQGVVDGQENPLSNIYSQRLHEALKYIIMTEHIYSWVVVTVSKTFFDGLTAEEQQILRDAGDIVVESMSSAVIEEDLAARKAMEKDGIIFVEPTEVFIQDLRAAAAPEADRFGAEIDSEIYNALKTEIKNYNK